MLINLITKHKRISKLYTKYTNIYLNRSYYKTFCNKDSNKDSNKDYKKDSYKNYKSSTLPAHYNLRLTCEVLHKQLINGIYIILTLCIMVIYT